MREKSIVKNAIYKILLNFFNIIVPLIIGPYSYRVLGKESMGLLGKGEAIYNYFLILAAFGIYQYGLREISRLRNDKAKLQKVFTSLFTIGILSNLTVLTIYIVFSYISFGYTPKFLVLMMYGISLIGNLFFVEWANEALENYDFITIKTMIIKVLYLICLFTFVKKPSDFIIFALLVNLSNFLNYFVSFVYIKKSIGFDFQNIELKKHIRFLLMTLIMSNANILYTQLDRLMLPESVLANYTLPQSIVLMINALILSIVYVTIPRLSNMLGNNDEVAYLSLLNRVSETLCAFLFPASIGILVLAPEIVILFGGNQYYGAIMPLRIFAIFMISLGFESILSNQVLYVKGREKKLVKFILIGGVSNVIFNSALIFFNRFTPNTAIATTALANLILIGLEYTYTRKVLKIDLQILSIRKLKYLLIALMFIPVTFGIKVLVSGIIKVTILTVSINALIYILVLYSIKDYVVITIISKVQQKFLK